LTIVTLFFLYAIKNKECFGLLAAFFSNKRTYVTISQSVVRIVSIFQPDVHSIPIGKIKSKIKFGSQLGACLANGLSWDIYNEAKD
jgi:hypothetical protein